MKRVIVMALVATSAVVGCDEKKNGTTTTPSATPSATTAPLASASAAPTATAAATGNPEMAALPADLATEDDFWEEAEKEVTKDNMDAELAKIEKELAAAK